jgi:cold shock CspA family protein
MERYIGLVAHTVEDRGYFFILYNGQRIFCHASHWSEFKFPGLGDRVSFEIGPGRGSRNPLQAVNVRPEFGLSADPLTVAGTGV